MTTTIPLPPGALHADDWEPNGVRHFRGTRRGDVEIGGIEEATGRVRLRYAWIDGVDSAYEYSWAALRELAADILATADELEGMEK
jgi:hypothetical protein